MKELVYLLQLTKEELKVILYNYLLKKKMSPVFEDGFVYAKGDIPILLVAHMDTVFDEPPKELFYSKKEDKLFSFDGGIGGDDRCGVYAILKLLDGFRPHVLFTEDEELGCVGALKAVQKLPKPDVKYIIELDRKGSNDCVFYECGNTEFMNYIESFGFVTDFGSYSDISVLGSAWDIAAANLSSGYYNEHTDLEYIKFKELRKNINRVKAMLIRHKKAKYFDYQEILDVLEDDLSFSDDSSYEDFMFGLDELYNSNVEIEEQDTGKKLVLRKETESQRKNGDK